MYESHVTVTGMDDGEFVSLCRNLGVKPVIIEEDTGSDGLRQMMTAKFHFTDDLDRAMAEMKSIASNFCTVRRCKLEYIVGSSKTPLPEHKYLEFHTKYELEDYEVEPFLKVISSLGGHTSRNVLKHPTHPNRHYYFATSRDRLVWKRMLAALSDYSRVNSIMECVVYDDAPEIDCVWAHCGTCCGLKAIPDSEFQDMIAQGML